MREERYERVEEKREREERERRGEGRGERERERAKRNNERMFGCLGQTAQFREPKKGCPPPH